MPLEQRLGAGGGPPGGFGSRSGSRDHRPATVGGPVRVGIAGRPSRGAAVPRAASRARGAAGLLRCVPPPPSRVRSGARVSLVSAPGPDEVPDQVGQRGVVGGADQVGQRRGRTAPARRRAARGSGAPPVGRRSSGSGSSSGARSAGHEADPAVAAGQRRRRRPTAPRRRWSARRASRGSSRAPGPAARATPARWPAPARRPAARRRARTPSAPRSRPPTPLPGRREPGQRADRDRLDLLAQLGQAAPPDRAQHLGVAPLLAAAAGPELAGDQPAGAGEPLQRRGRRRRRPRPSRAATSRGLERAVGAGVAADQVAERVGDRLGEHLGHARPAARCRARRAAGRRPRWRRSAPRRRCAPAAPGGRRPARPATPAARPRAAASAAVRSPTHAQQVGGAVDVAGVPLRSGSRCSSASTSAIAVGVEQLAQLGRGRAARRAGRCPAPAPRRAARPAARRPRRGTGRRSRTAATGRTARRCRSATSTTRTSRDRDVAHQLDQARDVVDVLQHSRAASRMIGNEANSLATDEQLGGALALLPQRGAPARVAAGEQQRPGGALAEPAGEQRRAADLGGDLALDLVGVEDGEVGLGRLAGGVGQPQHDAVVGVHRRRRRRRSARAAGRRAPAPRARSPARRTGSARPAASRRARRGTARPPACGRRAGGRWPPSARQVGQQVGRAPLVEPGGPGPLQRRPPASAEPTSRRNAPERPAELERPARGVAVPERHLARAARAPG